MSENQKSKQINIELSDEVAQGIYSNLAIITHSHSEFVVDFVTMMPGIPKAKVKSRIILTPQHAKRLLKALKDNVTKFESMHGAIKESEVENMPFSLGGPTAQA
jgi:translation initiation factor 2B subunit (eIF-2B alpha/beta/delta family)